MKENKKRYFVNINNLGHSITRKAVGMRAAVILSFGLQCIL